MIKRFLFLIIIFGIALVSSQIVYAQGDQDLYSQGVSASRRGETDFAFINFHALVETCPDSKYFEHALFSIGEYYFSVANYENAKNTFLKLINKFAKTKTKPFALVYLIEIAKRQNQEDLVKELEKQIIRYKQTSLIFRDFKEYRYVSGFSKRYKAVYFIDRIEIYINNELSARIPL